MVMFKTTPCPWGSNCRSRVTGLTCDVARDREKKIKTEKTGKNVRGRPKVSDIGMVSS